MSINDLTSLIPPPAQPRNVPTDVHWSRVEAGRGVRLPVDYKEFLSTYGEGRVGEFVDIFVPEARKEWHDLRTALEQERQVFAERRYPLRYDLDGEVDSWKVAFYESRGEDVEVFNGGLTAFLCEAFRGGIHGFPEGVARSFARQDE